jgi:HD domain
MHIDKKIVELAADRASALLASSGNRWLHVQGVVERACQISGIFNEEDQIYLIAAAYLHDIGYSPVLNKTSFHPLDGAHYALEFFHDERLASLVAHHSEALFEARLRGVEQALKGFPREQSAVAHTLTYCDMTTSASGTAISFQERITEIFNRYSEQDIVAQSLRQAIPFLSRDVEHTRCMLQKHGVIQ